MPDWSYRTLFRPLLFRIPSRAAREVCLGVMGALARVSIGRVFIDFLGHMGPPEGLRRSRLGLSFPSPVGLGTGIDANAVALPALARFGFGFLEVGPVTLRTCRPAAPIERQPGQESIRLPDPPENPGLEEVARKLERLRGGPLPVIVRLSTAQEELRGLVARLGPLCDAFALEVLGPRGTGVQSDAVNEALRAMRDVVDAVSPTRPLFVCLSPDLEPLLLDRMIAEAVAVGVGGVIIDGAIRGTSGGRLLGAPAREPALAAVRRARERGGEGLTIVAGGGVHAPEDALRLIEAGADLIQVESGLVYGGPGLPKRINEALAFARAKTEGESAVPVPPAPELTWFWTFLLGLGMLAGGILALAIAATRVVLPYDETFSGLSRAQLEAANPHLLSFMAHDRVSLAGTMVTIGVLYTGLSWFGIKRGLHWARVAVLTSAFAGFGSFFLFLGFGYFDPFHAFVTAALLQLLLLGLHSRLTPPRDLSPPGLHDDRRWRLSLWGQLLFIIQATAFIVAGLVISGVGITTVFVPEDLEYLRTTADELAAVSPRLLPLIAHDRASFGGMLVASGLAFLLPSLWGFRRGASWLWWTILLAGLPGYAAAIGVHFAVGYENLWHLTPAFAGAALFASGLALSYPYLCGSDPVVDAEWGRHFEAMAEQLGTTQAGATRTM